MSSEAAYAIALAIALLWIFFAGLLITLGIAMVLCEMPTDGLAVAEAGLIAWLLFVILARNAEIEENKAEESDGESYAYQ